jgi:pyruvate dehydrogenase E2 component (dihydrolipoamide acetyltransferase)
MAEKVVMLALSPTMEDGTIVSWNKGEGDRVSSGDVLCEVETDKATMDYESTQEGILLKIIVQEGGSAKVEEPIAIIGEEGENIDDLLEEIVSEGGGAEAADSEEAAEKTESKEKAGAEGKNAETVKTGIQREEAEGDGRSKASPIARNLARQAGIDLARISGSGPGGRVVKRDIETAISSGSLRPRLSPELAEKVRAAEAGAGGEAAGSAGASATGIEERRIPVSRKRKVIAQRLSESKFTAPHYYLGLSVNVDAMMRSRKHINERMQKRGAGKLGLNAFLMKLAAEAIKRYPIVNSTWEEEEIHIHGSIDIGLAVAQEDGLITPVLRNCGAKGIARISAELDDLVERARNNDLSPEEYRGATFSISNLGSYGIEEFTAVINPPGSAILAVGAVTEQARRLENGTISFDTVMKVTLSCDHRVIDGAVGADFLRSFKEIAEDPYMSFI